MSVRERGLNIEIVRYVCVRERDIYIYICIMYVHITCIYLYVVQILCTDL